MKKRQIDKIKNLGLAAFEQKLRSMAQEDESPLGLDALNSIQPAVLSEENRQQFLNTVKRAAHERALEEASKKCRKAELPFGRHLQTIRDQSGLTQADIARLLNKPPSYIDKLESGQINPLTILATDLAQIMQLFRITLSGLKKTISAFLLLSTRQTGGVSVMARSSIQTGTKERGDGLGHARDAVLQAIAKKKGGQDAQQIPPDFLQSVQDVLKQRGEEKLLV